MSFFRKLLKQRQQHSQEDAEMMDAMMNNAAMMMTQFDTSDEPQGRGSRPGRSPNHPRHRLSRGKNLLEDYFIERPIFEPEDFRRRYRMQPHVFDRIMTALCNIDPYWHQKPDALGELGLLPQKKKTQTVERAV
ncbi:hypothetical protein ACLB2K_004533 [Fragaria x ananassa]